MCVRVSGKVPPAPHQLPPHHAFSDIVAAKTARCLPLMLQQDLQSSLQQEQLGKSPRQAADWAFSYYQLPLFTGFHGQQQAIARKSDTPSRSSGRRSSSNLKSTTRNRSEQPKPAALPSTWTFALEEMRFSPDVVEDVAWSVNR
ncbi:uncharacterized protein EMH_0045290 [Eimeria mitis]|uniref:Uncharacterized protein n=1 Tax=Eimeria mitis TaxID=44415 RepID=U6JW04_9EIME|nr:uncharacterized protein EMH_0045290 [Eimeria mitis]CDJ28931.1 hypothetical protein EMH_0045290 [Eimeria mitis]